MSKPYDASIAIIGCGDVGRRLAHVFQSRGVPVTGVVARPQRAADLTASGIRALAMDLDLDQALSGWPAGFSTYYYFVPPSLSPLAFSSDDISTSCTSTLSRLPALREFSTSCTSPLEGVGDARVQRFLAHLSQHQDGRCRVIYLSTTAVYGDCQGAWVDELRPANPQSSRGKRRWDAENQVREWAQSGAGREQVVLRVGGIYGPGRWPEQRLRQGLPVLAERDSPFVNRIHVEDLVQVCVAAAEKAPAGAIYNVADGKPGSMTDYFNRVADALKLPRPPQVPWAQAGTQLTPQLLSYLQESRRLNNSKMLKELGIVLLYPDLARGLADLSSSAAGA